MAVMFAAFDKIVSNITTIKKPVQPAEEKSVQQPVIQPAPVVAAEPAVEAGGEDKNVAALDAMAQQNMINLQVQNNMAQQPAAEAPPAEEAAPAAPATVDKPTGKHHDKDAKKAWIAQHKAEHRARKEERKAEHDAKKAEHHKHHHKKAGEVAEQPVVEQPVPVTPAVVEQPVVQPEPEVAVQQ